MPQKAAILIDAKKYSPGANCKNLILTCPYPQIITLARKYLKKNRISFMFSSWDYIPKVYEKHEHWGNYNNDFVSGKQHEPKPMEFDIK